MLIWRMKNKFWMPVLSALHITLRGTLNPAALHLYFLRESFRSGRFPVHETPVMCDSSSHSPCPPSELLGSVAEVSPVSARCAVLGRPHILIWARSSHVSEDLAASIFRASQSRRFRLWHFYLLPCKGRGVSMGRSFIYRIPTTRPKD